MELRHLEYFVAVAEELSFTRASRRLHVVQSGVSSAIQGLERELGAALFDRDRHRVTLTEAGQALLPEARATLAAAQAAADAVAEATAGLRGTLFVGTMISTGPVDVPALLARFHEQHPGVLVRLRALPGGSADLAREVASGGLDLALLSLPGDPPAGLAVRQLAHEPMALICAASHPLAGRHRPAPRPRGRDVRRLPRRLGHPGDRRPGVRRRGHRPAGVVRGGRLRDRRGAGRQRARSRLRPGVRRP